MKDVISIKGARQHNLKNINVDIPKNKLIVLTGLSGSGKSSLAFDTIYAEGQRRYVESLSAYARQFLGIMDKPDVETIDGLSPAIAIDQKSISHNPRSTVGTTTEIYDYLRLLFARIGHPHCPKCGREISKQSPGEITDSVMKLLGSEIQNSGQVKAIILAPVIRDRKGEFTALFENLRSQGFQRVRIDGRMFALDEDFLLIKTNKHSIDVVLDRITWTMRESRQPEAQVNLRARIAGTVEQALEVSGGLLTACIVKDSGFTFPEKPSQTTDHLYSEWFACPEDNLSLPEIEPRSFSFNSPHGACPTCNGIGSLLKVAPELVVNPDLTIAQGAILPYARTVQRETWFARTIGTILEAYNESPHTPWKNCSESLRNLLLFGDPSRIFTVYGPNRFGRTTSFDTVFEGVIENLNRRYRETDSEIIRAEIEKFMRKEICPACEGKRLKKEALSVTIRDHNIVESTDLQISESLEWVQSLSQENAISQRETQIASPILKELKARLGFLTSVGLSYITLSREASSLSGGESQRIRLASQIGSGLSGVLYVLDEPTIGLHQKDNRRLLTTLKQLRDLGNTVLLVEHDRETMENADWIIDFGPGAGKRGGEVVAKGPPNMIKRSPVSLTGKYLSGKKRIAIEKHLTEKPSEPSNLILRGCKEHNLKNITVSFPLQRLICVTGVSGSGKSTLVHSILYHAIARELNFLHRDKPGRFEEIVGLGGVARVRLIDQNPIGRTPRSNPATYTKVFDHIRQLFALTKESAVRGYRPGRFSFNIRGGRCEACQGGGEVKIEMQFLPDVYVKCEVCLGKRYNTETLEIQYKGKTVSDVLQMTVEEALDFFANVPVLQEKLQTIKDVGLGYIELGQPAPTLSGGEAQRIKIARELSVKTTGHTVYLLDEPTTGLHFADLEKLLKVLRKLTDAGNTVIVIEHNLDVIKNADHIIDLGPDGGDDGGEVVATGTPLEVAKVKRSYTGQYLRQFLPLTS
ncbi:MAG: excinuclease ABC subunit A [Candidatus Chisholmbacteria bacterium RIFCSPLOWO2_01_FULL_50_28]|uniref:UvrABC system protein A n=1 Tax=Candidatus Chisholmbacteria bacterium RIFCSPHIGHO2_01_FULL_52_32 TaxID=1797591 RepID=A0A1G1VSM9_9BACT|nr:MAG: excinuclease ABC subunit A [Candidatus Chisholmbacteria bacterium RIFCSPHIGHO2_01_FULL_52_32]OGY20259.1 MAG: excinuclease ABC subunit A [Candidatus Chisholmbacteria bacterium RIFCSPLOWO2_01_FULL_50_28]